MPRQLVLVRRSVLRSLFLLPFEVPQALISDLSFRLLDLSIHHHRLSSASIIIIITPTETSFHHLAHPSIRSLRQPTIFCYTTHLTETPNPLLFPKSQLPNTSNNPISTGTPKILKPNSQKLNPTHPPRKTLILKSLIFET